MARIRFLDAHRNWEDWGGMLLGVLIGLSPWLSGQMGTEGMMFNAILVGALVFVLAQYELADLHRWEQVGEIVVGSWLIASPFIFDYSAAGPLRFWHFVLGTMIVSLALLELRQDWALGNDELAKHGE